MPVGVRLLVGHVKAAALEVEVIDVGKPHPGASPLRRDAIARCGVVLRQLVGAVGVLDLGCGQGVVKVRVHDLAVVGGHVAPACGVVELVELNRAVAAPAPQNGRVKLMRVQIGIPIPAFGRDLYADLGHLIRELVGERLTRGVAGSIE